MSGQDISFFIKRSQHLCHPDSRKDQACRKQIHTCIHDEIFLRSLEILPHHTVEPFRILPVKAQTPFLFFLICFLFGFDFFLHFLLFFPGIQSFRRYQVDNQQHHQNKWIYLRYRICKYRTICSQIRNHTSGD